MGTRGWPARGDWSVLARLAGAYLECRQARTQVASRQVSGGSQQVGDLAVISAGVCSVGCGYTSSEHRREPHPAKPDRTCETRSGCSRWPCGRMDLHGRRRIDRGPAATRPADEHLAAIRGSMQGGRVLVTVADSTPRGSVLTTNADSASQAPPSPKSAPPLVSIDARAKAKLPTPSTTAANLGRRHQRNQAVVREVRCVTLLASIAGERGRLPTA